jgi:two-component sensor histidine kinase/GGDEF domain-containing protein
LDGIAGEINPKQNKILTTSRNNIDRLARIINSLLDISKIESGRIELKKGNVDMGVLIKNVVSMFEPKAKEKGLELRVIFPKDLGMNLYVDEDRITQVFTNLISNAIKFTEKGVVSVSLTENENEVEFIVSDTGVGIAAEDLPKVFNKFQQFGRSVGTGALGTGLGLSIAKGLIELHRGEIRVESEVAKGTRFIFTLPRYPENQNARKYIEDAINDAFKAGSHLSLIVVTFNYSDKMKLNIPSGLFEKLEGIIREQLYRSKDLVLKYPSEFIIILYSCNKNNGFIVQGRIEQALRSYLDGVGLNQDLKLSFGVATYPDEVSSYQELINKARLT